MISGSEGQKADAIWYQGVKIFFDSNIIFIEE